MDHSLASGLKPAGLAGTLDHLEGGGSSSRADRMGSDRRGTRPHGQIADAVQVRALVQARESVRATNLGTILDQRKLPLPDP